MVARGVRRIAPLGMALAGVLWAALAAPGMAATGAPRQRAPGAAPGAGGPATRLAGLTADNSLLLFESATPGTIAGTVSISGLQPGESIVAIDVRPSSGGLYGLGVVDAPGADTGRLYLIDPASGAATQVGAAPFSVALADGASHGFDFNPVADRIRVVSDADENLRLNPNTGLQVAADTALNNPAGEETVTGSAYDGNYVGANQTTLYGIDAGGSLVMQGGVNAGQPGGSPNGGAITTIGPLGVTPASGRLGFEIAPDGAAYVAMTSGGGLVGLYTVNLSTGAMTFVGAIGAGVAPVIGLAALSPAPNYLPLLLRP